MSGQRNGSSSSNPASSATGRRRTSSDSGATPQFMEEVAIECKKIDDEYRNKLKKDRNLIEELRKKGRPLLNTLQDSQRKVDDACSVESELIEEENTWLAKKEQLRADSESITDSINRETSKYKKKLATHMKKIKEAEEASKIRQTELDEIKEKINKMKQNLESQKSEVKTRLDEIKSNLKAQKELIKQYKKQHADLDKDYKKQVGTKLSTTEERFRTDRWARAQKIQSLIFKQYRANVNNAREKTRDDVVQMINAEHENEDISDEQIEIEQLLKILKIEMDFFESLVDRAVDIALLDPHISHALLEVAIFEYLNHDNFHEASHVSQELQDHFLLHIAADKHCDSETRHSYRLISDIRLTFLDSIVERRRNTTKSMDSETGRPDVDYLKYLKISNPLDTDRKKTLYAYKAYWDRTFGGHYASDDNFCEENYAKVRDEWEFRISCGVDAIKYSTSDPVKSSALKLAAKWQHLTILKEFIKMPEKRSKDDIAIAPIDEQVKILEEYLDKKHDEDLRFDKTSYISDLGERKKQLDEIVKKLDKLKKGKELPAADPMIRSHYVKGDVIEEYVRMCFTYGRDYIDTKQYAINCAWAQAEMQKLKNDIKASSSYWTDGGDYIKDLEEFRNTGSSYNDTWVATIIEYAKLHCDYANKIPDAMDAALKERNDNDKLIAQEMQTFVKALVNKSIK